MHGNTLLFIEIHLIPIIANIKNDGRTRNNVWRMKYFHLRCDNQITCNGIKDYPKSVTNANCSYGISVMFWAKGDSLSTWLGDFSQPEREMTFTSDVLQLFSFISLWRNRFLLLLQRGESICLAISAFWNTNILKAYCKKNQMCSVSHFLWCV